MSLKEEVAVPCKEYRIYIDTLLRPFTFETFKAAVDVLESGRLALEQALVLFLDQLRHYVPGCDDRKLSRACLRRARGIEAQLAVRSPLVPLLKLLHPDDMHGIWHGFVAMRHWRDSRVPQECMLSFLGGFLGEFCEDVLEEWKQQALTEELPKVQQSISVAAWPGICRHLGRLPHCVTPCEIRETLWQQAFVENPTRAPGHRNFRRFALLAAQMVAIGVELESEKVEFLFQQVLNLDRPWRERRDMLSGILSAASVSDRQRVVQNLDQRFDAHADIEDFEIVCGIAEHIGLEIPPEGAIRRCALRRWALDTKRGGALPVTRLMDFVDMDLEIGEDVAYSLKQRGRVVDAALLLARLPRPNAKPARRDLGIVDVLSGDVEMDRLQQVLALADDGGNAFSVFGPVTSAGFLLPCHFGGLCTSPEAVLAACDRLETADILALQLFREEAPFWHRPGSLLVLCSAQHAELFDLPKLRACDPSAGPNAWPQAAQRLRALLSAPKVLKVVWGGMEEVIDVAVELSLGIALPLRSNDREALGPVVDTKVLSFLGKDWPRICQRCLGRLCTEEEGSNWARRPLRLSQLHHGACMTWTQLAVLQAACAHHLVSADLVWSNFCIQFRPRVFLRSRDFGKHTLGQLAPPGRLRDAKDPGSSMPTRVALLKTNDSEPEAVEVVGDVGALAAVVPLGAPLAEAVRKKVDPRLLSSVNCWEYSAWVARLPRADETGSAEEKSQQQDEALPAFATRLGTAGAPKVTEQPAAKAAAERKVPARRLLWRLFEQGAAADLLQSAYAAQPASLMGCYE
ncbi:unnamed protein product [Effrenium voratum]|uniref:Uncharacterized protein n=1 Tax=Effrenium voratum TaxID=2562239 RepID=A0AA36HX35_9DINO|nr:unnamed protein product [Effrenium voratum]